MARVFGTNGADNLLGNDFERDLISGGTEANPAADTGNDTLYGLGGGDTLLGQGGNDDLYAGNGADSLDGGKGDDFLQGGLGSDTLLGGAGNDELRAEGELPGFRDEPGANNLLIGGGGDDSLFGEGGTDTLRGGVGADSLVGEAGDDRLVGGGGNDTLQGDEGFDRLIGGNGADLFVFGGPSEGRDVIADFTPGEDRIGISSAGFGEDWAQGALDASLFEINNRGIATEADTRFIYEADQGRLWWDADGSGGGDAPVVIAVLTDAPHLSASDFLVVA